MYLFIIIINFINYFCHNVIYMFVDMVVMIGLSVFIIFVIFQFTVNITGSQMSVLMFNVTSKHYLAYM